MNFCREASSSLLLAVQFLSSVIVPEFLMLCGEASDFIGAMLSSVIQACLLQDCFQVLKEWCKPGSLPATPVHAQPTHCGLALLPLGSWFKLYGMDGFYISSGTGTHRCCLAAAGSLRSNRQVLFREMSLLPWILFGMLVCFFFPLEIWMLRN